MQQMKEKCQKPIANGQKVLIVIGEHLNKKAITSYIEGGPEYE